MPRVAFVGARRIALVEHQVDHGRHGGEPLRPLDRARRLEGQAGIADAGLGAGDALLHRRLADQEGARDLLDRQPADDAQRQCDLLRRRQLGMAAHEQEPQDVVTVLLAIEPVGQRAFGVAEVGDRRLVGQRHLLGPPAHIVHRRIAADEDQPCRGVARWPILWPGLQRAQAGLLKCLLGRIEIAEVAQQRPHCLGARGGQDRVDPADVVHAAGFRSTASWLSCSSATGRIS